MSQKVRAKFNCQHVIDFGSSKEVRLRAIYGTEGENADFSKATPSGTVDIQIDQETPASEFFKPGKDYYLDFTASE